MTIIEEDGDKSIMIVPSEMVKDVSDHVIAFLREAIKHSIEGYDAEHYLDLCSSGQATLWAGSCGVSIMGYMISVEVKYPKYSSLRVVFCGGIPGCLHLFCGLAWKALTRWAKHRGITKIEEYGRVGWETSLGRLAGVHPSRRAQVLVYEVAE